MQYETRAERRIRYGQYALAVAAVLLTVAGLVLGFWGFSLPDPSMVGP